MQTFDMQEIQKALGILSGMDTCPTCGGQKHSEQGECEKCQAHRARHSATRQAERRRRNIEGYR